MYIDTHQPKIITLENCFSFLLDVGGFELTSWRKTNKDLCACVCGGAGVGSAGDETRASFMLSKHFTTELYPSLSLNF